MWYDFIVTVSREVDNGTSSSGQQLLTLTVINSSVECDLQPISQEIATLTEGETILCNMLMICDVADIQADDVITDTETGLKYLVMEVVKGRLLPHLAVKLRGGVV